MEQTRLASKQYIRNEFKIQAEEKWLETDTPLHWHEYFEAEIILEGKGTQSLNGKKYPLHKGALYFLTPADFHEICVEEPLHLYNVSFELSTISLPFLNQVINDENRFFYPAEVEYTRLLNLIILLADACNNEFAEQEYLHSLLNCLLIRFTHLINTEQAALKRLSSTAIVQNALLYLHLHFREQLTLNDIATFTHISPNYLSELFRQETKVTVTQYLRDLRIDYAKKLLCSTELSVLEICFACGYSSCSNFMKYFKLKTGRSPLQYKKLLRKADFINPTHDNPQAPATQNTA